MCVPSTRPKPTRRRGPTLLSLTRLTPPHQGEAPHSCRRRISTLESWRSRRPLGVHRGVSRFSDPVRCAALQRSGAPARRAALRRGICASMARPAGGAGGCRVPLATHPCWHVRLVGPAGGADSIGRVMPWRSGEASVRASVTHRGDPSLGGPKLDGLGWSIAAQLSAP
jgi:hypothetical protein